MQVQVPDNSITGTGDAAGYFTVSTNVGFYPGAVAYLIKSDGSESQLCKITELLGSTKIGLVFLPESTTDPKLKTGVVTYPNYGRSDLTDYDAGSLLSMEAQPVPVYQPMFDPLVRV